MAYAFEYIHLGEKIHALLMKGNYSKKSLADFLGNSAGNASYIIKRESLDVRTVHQIGMMLQYNFWQHFPFPFDKTAKNEMDKKVGELEAKIAEKDKEIELLKMQMEAVKSENALMKDVMAVLKKK